MKSGLTDKLPEWIKQYDPQLLQGIAVFLILLVIFIIFSYIRKKREKTSNPKLTIQSFQIAPLGRDAFLKLNNPSTPLTLLSLEILDRPDLHIKNQVGGHVLTTGANYSILLEANGSERMNPDFNICITFVDAHKHTYRQIFSLDPIKSISLRRKKY